MVELDLSASNVTQRAADFDELAFVTPYAIYFYKYLTPAATEPANTARVNEQEVLQEIQNRAARLFCYSLADQSVHPAHPEPLRVMRRLADGRCVVQLGSDIALLTLESGAMQTICELPPGAQVGGSAISPQEAWLAFGVQLIGRNWHLFDLYTVETKTGLSSRVRSNIVCAMSPNSHFAPTLTLQWLDDRRLAVVETQVTAQSHGQPTDGQYFTTVLHMPGGTVVGRFRHPQRGLSDSPPAVQIPPDNLAELGLSANAIEPGQDPAEPSAPVPAGKVWEHFLRYDNGRLRAADGQSFPATDLSGFQLSPDGNWLAVRNQKPDAPAQVWLLGQTASRLLPIPGSVTEFFWLGP